MAHHPIDPLPKRQRSRIANGHLHTRRIDLRSGEARRWRDTYLGYRSELRGTPTPAQEQLLRRAATLSVVAEGMDADLASGNPVDPGQAMQLASVLNSVLVRLGIGHGGSGADRDPRPATIDTILAENSSDANGGV